MLVRYLGHSCFTVSDGIHTVILDPFLTGNPDAARGPDDVVADGQERDVDALIPDEAHVGKQRRVAGEIQCSAAHGEEKAAGRPHVLESTVRAGHP